MPTTAKTAWRRMYVFLAVALAVFLLALNVVGFVCHGFAMSPPRVDPSTASIVSACEAQPLPVPPEIKTAISAADEQSLAAYRAAQKAVDTYQATAIELQDLLSQHFDSLLHVDLSQFEQAADLHAAPATPPSTELSANPVNQPVSAQPPAVQSMAEQTADEPPAPPASFETPPVPEMAINPQWQELQDQIDGLLAQRDHLAATMLPTHPTMQKLEDSLADLQRQQQTVPKEIPAENIPQADVAAAAPKMQPQPQPAIAAPEFSEPSGPSAASVFAALLPGWQSTAEQYHELTARLQADQTACYRALDRESQAWRRKAEIPTDYIATLTVPQPALNSPVFFNGADPRWAIDWCGLLAVLIAGLVASGARVSEAVFRTASEVRQRLTVSILGFLPQKTADASRQFLQREPRWVSRLLLTAELCLVAAVIMLATVSIVDRQFFNNLLANPLAACSQKFWC